MNWRAILLLLLSCFAFSNLWGQQLTARALELAVERMECDKIAPELANTPLRSEAMKFNGAVCFYRNGEVERAQAVFQEIRQMEAQKQHLAAFWLGKCHAAMGRDSLAVATLQSIQLGILNYRMLSQKEFDHLSNTNQAFIQLKQSLAPAFNAWTVILGLISGLGGLVGLLLLFGKSRFSVGEKKLSLVMFSFAIILASYVLIWTGYVHQFPYLQNTWQTLTLLVGPSLYFYLKDIFKEEYSKRQIVYHYAIPTISGLLALPNYLSNYAVNTGISPDFFTIGTAPTLLTSHLIFYAMLIYLMTKNEWQVDANIRVWTRIIAWGMIAYTLAFLSYFLLVQCSFFSPEWDYSISLVMALGILAVAYMGLLQRRIFSSEPIEKFLPVNKYQSSSLTPGASESIKRKMELLLAEQQVFRENELRLADLAAYLDVSRHQLSQVINEHYNVNFFELMNRYRLDHAKRLLANPAYSHYTIIQIAYEAGFNNKVSFNRIFKKEIGMTPSAYRIKENSEV
jgi:AraC-like DNA-binding protein